MHPNASTPSGLLRPIWSRIEPWILSLLVLAVLAAARFYSVFGPPQARILFPLHVLAMWALPFVLLTRQGRRRIGLRKPANSAPALALCAAAGAAGGFFIFWIGTALYGQSPENWCISIRDSFQLRQMLALMPRPAVFAIMALPAMILTPVGEEILFRGLLQESFTLRWNSTAATLVNGLAFGFIHLHVHGFWRDQAGFHLRIVSGALMVLLLAALSAMFTLCRLRTGSLFAAMVAHAACNLAIVAAVFFYFAN